MTGSSSRYFRYTQKLCGIQNSTNDWYSINMASTIGYEKNLKVTNLHWTGKTVHKSTWCSPDQTSVDLGIVGENFFDSTYWSDRIYLQNIQLFPITAGYLNWVKFELHPKASWAGSINCWHNTTVVLYYRTLTVVTHLFGVKWRHSWCFWHDNWRHCCQLATPITD